MENVNFMRAAHAERIPQSRADLKDILDSFLIRVLDLARDEVGFLLDGFEA